MPLIGIVMVISKSYGWAIHILVISTLFGNKHFGFGNKQILPLSYSKVQVFFRTYLNK